jgi:hypothetical protein
MTRPSRRLIALALIVATVLALAACGEEDAKLLPGGTAQEISENLDSVQRLVDEEECEEAEAAALEVSAQVDALRGIDPKLKQALEEGAARLNEVVDRCEEEGAEDTDEEAEPTTAEPTEDETQDEEELKKQEEEEKKEEEEQRKQEEKEQKEEEGQEGEGDEEPAEDPDLPSQANGKAKGHEETPAEPPAETPSGGIGPGAEAGGGD